MADRCRICGGVRLRTAVDLGHHPLADRFLTAADLDEPEVRYPLRVQVCEECGYAGLSRAASADERYRRHAYSYTSSNSSVSRLHFTELAGELARRVPLGSLVVDVGGNDGTLLSAIRAIAGCEVLNIEPSSIGDLSAACHVETIRDFLTDEVAERVRARGGASVVVATNVLNHADDPVRFLVMARAMLAEGGSVVVEVPSLEEMSLRRSFDTIYAEHVSYFSRDTLRDCLSEAGFGTTDVEDVDYMGGSLRAWAVVSPAPRASRERRPRGLVSATIRSVERLGEDAATIRTWLSDFLRTVAGRPASVAALCASAKGNTMLNHCQVGRDLVSCVVDPSPHKAGKFTPGTHLPIVADVPDGARWGVVLAPNLLPLLRTRHPELSLVVPSHAALPDPSRRMP